jgi:hypothetical protein
MNFLDFKHLLLVDLSSSGLSFYLAKDVKDLASIDFTNLTLLKSVYTNQICRVNLLADDLALQKILSKNLKVFDLESYSLVFLLAPGHSELEKKAIEAIAPFLKKISFVDRHFFYNFYLMQKRNFSKIKFLISLFDDCAELSLFDQEKLLSYERIALRNLAFSSKVFFKRAREKFEFEQPDCFYFFTNNLAEKPDSLDLAKYLKLEAIEVENLC